MIKFSLGFTLIEMLISLFLGSLAVIGLLEVNNIITTNTMLQNGLTRVQDEGRYAVMYLDHHIRSAGFSKCLQNYTANPFDVVSIYQAEKIPHAWNIHPVSNSDVLILGACEVYQGRNQFVKTAYFVGVTQRHNRRGQPITALYEKHWGGKKQELSEGVEDMDILAGESEPDFRNILKYKNAGENTHWQWVKSIKFSLLINSVEPALTYSQRVAWKGKIFLTQDRLLHKPWFSYVELRERS